ncbi:PhzF family phenazine biosynthesis protein [Flammeovirga sp. MY04]|uniref:PhzF family phenazine biosynthesis protein n=1 Tax=Flammeovirga sp. MY04 TaxID=1191459 RepID=UPI0008061AF7|nr:PhzF family phenazine biosynthesis protein [Flammeovirga sp. MY04]ANQ51339.1 PhzF family phenazine biosynthesis protein [Flammeovirga sp. MY04]
MTLPIYQIDAFCENIFEGNPAAVVPLTEWIPENSMQNIAMENNLAETVFFVPAENEYQIRWFTPETEIRLCGHATLAAAHYLFHHQNIQSDKIQFVSHLSGKLSVTKDQNGLTLNFPSQKPSKVNTPSFLEKALGCKVDECFESGMFLVAHVENEKTVKELTPNFNMINDQSPDLGIIVTAKGTNEADFVSRFFHPGIGINEDPVTGSAHTVLIPHWSEILGKNSLVAHQLSKRGGILLCEDQGERVLISGKAQTYLKGEIFI